MINKEEVEKNNKSAKMFIFAGISLLFVCVIMSSFRLVNLLHMGDINLELLFELFYLTISFSIFFISIIIYLQMEINRKIIDVLNNLTIFLNMKNTNEKLLYERVEKLEQIFDKKKTPK